MIKLDRILAPTDFSDFSKKALDYAIALAEAHSAAVLVLHVVPPPRYTAETPIAAEIYEEIEQAVVEQAERKIAEVRGASATSVPVDVKVVEGSPFLEIVRTARAENIDLIVLATHGLTGIRHVLLGSTAEKVVRKAPCAVLTVKEKERDFVLP